eukprot:3161329-Prymnesium_polylepis.1
MTNSYLAVRLDFLCGAQRPKAAKEGRVRSASGPGAEGRKGGKARPRATAMGWFGRERRGRILGLRA